MAERTGISAKLWLALLKDGGRWTVADVAARSGVDGLSAHQNLISMSKAGKVRRFDPGPGQRVQYGVTPGCTVPQGVTMADILGCDLFRQEPGA